MLTFHISSFLLMWILYSVIVAICANIVLGLFLFFFLRNGWELYNDLYVGEDDATDTDLNSVRNVNMPSD